MGLFDFLKKSSAPAPQNDEQKDWAKDLTISLNIKNEVKPLEDVFVGCAVALKQKQPVDKEIEILQRLIAHYEEAKRRCHTLGPDYIKYFDESWDTVMKNKEDGPSYITRYKKRLQYINEHYDELKNTEAQYQQQVQDLDKRLAVYLYDNSPVLQSDIYKSFGPLVKNDIRDLLYRMERDGKVTREKSGRSYIVTLK